jgi:hypothetical protein
VDDGQRCEKRGVLLSSVLSLRIDGWSVELDVVLAGELENDTICRTNVTAEEIE